MWPSCLAIYNKTMRSKDYLKNSLPKTAIKSTAKFNGNFEEELTKTINIFWEYLDKNLEKIFELDYIDIGNKTIKIKVNDSILFIQKIVNIVIDYNAVDEKYGNIRVEVTVTELSRKPKFYLIWKLHVLERDKICEKWLSVIKKAIEEISEE